MLFYFDVLLVSFINGKIVWKLEEDSFFIKLYLFVWGVVVFKVDFFRGFFYGSMLLYCEEFILLLGILLYIIYIFILCINMLGI